ncbi:MAG: Hsp20/alpha crystallin family protein [Patescibacteria group bacterium]
MSFLEKLKKGLTEDDEDLELTTPAKKKPAKTKKINPEVSEIPLKELEPKEKIEEKKWPEPEGQLAVDVYQTEDELVIQTAIAGVKPEDLDITAQGDTVVIKGRREKAKEMKVENYFYQECYWGSFSREIILPVEADAARSQASMADGILTIRIPKIIKEGEKKIMVK